MPRVRTFDWRFWTPVMLLGVFALYASQKLVRAHVAPEVSGIDYTFKKSVPALRGTVYDCLGTPMATSVPVWDYHLDPVSVTNRIVRRKGDPPRTRAAILKTIASALKLDYGKVVAMAEDTRRRYQSLGVSSDPEAHRVLADSHLVSGVAIEDRQERQYLHRRLMSHVLGSVNAEHVGSAGIEQRYDRYLRGVPGEIQGVRDARRNELYDKRTVSVAATPGADVYLTIDHNLQYEAETALKDGLAEFEAGSGWCLVMEARTGALLAMASLPDFDPLAFGSASPSATVNRTCAYTYEPGSVMKVITATAGIDTGRVGPGTLYATNRDDDRYYRLPGDGSHVWEPRMSVREAVVHSSNIVIGKLGVDLGPEKLWTYMRAFGFGQKTGVELPGEEAGLLPHWQKWDKVKWSRAPIGQGVAVTALQLASAYQALANDGVRMRPHVVSRVVAADGTELYRHTDEPLGRPVKAETAKTMRNVMLGVASKEGTARRAAIPGFSVAGKTGTAQKVVNGKYSDQLYRATFCGIVPASRPEFVILVTLDFDKRTKFHQGGNSAAPVFRRLATAALRYRMVTPDRPDDLDEEMDEGEEDEFDRIVAERARKNLKKGSD